MTRRTPTKAAILLIVGCLVPSPGAFADDAPLGLADLEAYRLALAAKPDRSAPRVGFRDLWERPEEYAGRTVTVEGRVARTFRQPGSGEFPPLVEAWVVSPAGDPFCLVFPNSERRPPLEVGAPIRFSGTFLKRIRYQGGDVPRLAPLIVGSEAPEGAGLPGGVGPGGWSPFDWIMAVGASLVVGSILVSRHLSRPALPARSHEPPPSFVDGDPDTETEEDLDETG